MVWMFGKPYFINVDPSKYSNHLLYGRVQVELLKKHRTTIVYMLKYIVVYAWLHSFKPTIQSVTIIQLHSIVKSRIMNSLQVQLCFRLVCL